MENNKGSKIMQSINPVKSLAVESIDFFKYNLSYLLKLVVKSSILKFVVLTIFILLNNHSADFPKINFMFWCLSTVITYCANCSFAILITRHIVFNEKLTEPFIKTMYSSIVFRLFAPVMLYILSAIILIGLPIAVKFFLGNISGTGLLIIGIMGLIFIYVRFAMLATDIMVNNRIRLSYNLDLTREKFIDTLGAVALALCPFVIMALVTMALFYLLSLISSNSVTEFLEFCFQHTSTASFISTVFNFMYSILTMFIYAFGHIVMTKFYIRLNQQSAPNIDASAVLQSDLAAN